MARKNLEKYFLISFLLLFISFQSQSQNSAENTIHVLNIDGAIGPATSEFIRTGIEAAQTEAKAVIIEMNTPGGLDLSMRDIIQTILDSDIPVITYVSPQGSRAASAGTYILYASHIAAMAPATNLGAATPVQIATPSPADLETEADNGETAMERKIVNDARAYIRGLAELRGRNAEWAEAAVIEAASLSASEALAENVIDIVASDIGELVRSIHGRAVNIKEQSIVLSTENTNLQYIESDWRISFLKVITDPNLIIILGMFGIYGLIIEFYNPGFGLPGVVGAICLILAGYGLQLLPLNYAGVALIVVGLILIIAEALIPSFGIMGLGGIVAFSLGALIMIDTEYAVYQVSLPVVAAIGLAFALLLVVTLRLFINTKKKAVVSGIQTIIGVEGNSLTDFDKTGMVNVQGEIWNAVSEGSIQKGDKIKVVGTEGTHLQVIKN